MVVEADTHMIYVADFVEDLTIKNCLLQHDNLDGTNSCILVAAVTEVSNVRILNNLFKVNATGSLVINLNGAILTAMVIDNVVCGSNVVVGTPITLDAGSDWVALRNWVGSATGAAEIDAGNL